MDDTSEPQFFQPYQGNWLESFTCSVLRRGQIPRHVAFIMDGNRRYANKSNIDRYDGHKQGFNTLAKVLSWCRELGIHHVTLYAFSIENFKRTQDEVNSIMDLAREKCDSLLDELDKVNEAGIRVRVVGDLNLVPKDLKIKIDKIEKVTAKNDKAFLNICLAYTSRHEIVAAIQKLSTEFHQQGDTTANIDLATFEQKLFIPRPFPDMIIRTSGEVRLSDFMLWQSKDATLIFVDALWPEISIWDFMKAIFHWQCQRRFGPKSVHQSHHHVNNHNSCNNVKRKD